jgi:hypothetical protein
MKVIFRYKVGKDACETSSSTSNEDNNPKFVLGQGMLWKFLVALADQRTFRTQTYFKLVFRHSTYERFIWKELTYLS